jgi:hypothetical protein
MTQNKDYDNKIITQIKTCYKAEIQKERIKEEEEERQKRERIEQERKRKNKELYEKLNNILDNIYEINEKRPRRGLLSVRPSKAEKDIKSNLIDIINKFRDITIIELCEEKPEIY